MLQTGESYCFHSVGAFALTFFHIFQYQRRVNTRKKQVLRRGGITPLDASLKKLSMLYFSQLMNSNVEIRSRKEKAMLTENNQTNQTQSYSLVTKLLIACR